MNYPSAIPLFIFLKLKGYQLIYILQIDVLKSIFISTLIVLKFYNINYYIGFSSVFESIFLSIFSSLLITPTIHKPPPNQRDQ